MSKMPPGHWMRRFGYGTLFLSTFARGGLPNRASAWPGPYDVGDQVRLLKATRGGDSATDAPITIPAGSVGTVEEIERYGHAPAKFALVISGKGWATSQPHGTARQLSDWVSGASDPFPRQRRRKVGGRSAKRQGRSAKSYNRRVSKCISGKVREGWEQHSAVGACLSMDSDKRLRSDGSYIKGRRVHEIQSAQRYIVYGGYGEPLGILNYGGKYYYSDEPPWETPLDLAEGIYRTKRRSKLRLVSVGSVSDEVFEKAQYNERSGKYRKGMI